MKELSISAKRLKEERLKRGYSQEELGQKAYTTQQQICFIEKDKRELSREIAENIAEVLNIRHEYLLGKDDYRTEKDYLASYWGSNIQYQNNIDTQFYNLLEALEIRVTEEYTEEILKTTTLLLTNELKETGKSATSHKQVIKYNIVTPTERKTVSEESFLKFKDLILKYIVFLAEDLK